MISRQEVYDKYDGLCAYSGTPLEDDWQVDHLVSQNHGGGDNIGNLMPAQRIINHYKRALPVDIFRVMWLGGLHKRLGKPKNPRTDKSRKTKEYRLKVASYFGITPDKPFSGKFYFEQLED